MLPLTLGANIGTTVTGLLASLVSSSVKSLQVALCHLFFNISGILIWYPIPFTRKFPLSAARALGKTTRVWKGFPIYIFITFGVIPIMLFGLSTLFEQQKKGFTILGTFLVIILVGLIGLFVYKWFRGDLKENIMTAFEDRQRKNNAINSLPDDMETVKSEIAALKAHTGMPEPEEDKEDEEA